MNTEKELNNILNFFIRIPPKNYRWWRSAQDYVYEAIKWFEYRTGFSFPDHAIALMDGELETMCKRVRIIYTKGDIAKFKYLFRDKTQLDIDGIVHMDLADMMKDSQELYGW